jgi:hypothetical protein
MHFLENMEFKLYIVNWQTIASIVTLLLAIIAIIPIYKERRLLKVILTLGRTRDLKHNERVIIINIMNVSRRRMIPLSLWYTSINDYKKYIFFGKKPMYLLATQYLPKIIEEGNFHREYNFHLAIELNNIEDVIVFDTTGKLWKTKRKHIKKLKENAINDLNWGYVDLKTMIVKAKN